MAGYKLVVHSTCASSRSLLYGLRDRGLLERVELFRADKPVFGGVFLWSVPMLVSPDGRPLAMDPLGVDEVESILEGGGEPRKDIVEGFFESVLYSSYATGLVLLHGGFEPVVGEKSFLVPGLRLWAGGVMLDDVVSELRGVAERLFEERFEVLARAASIAYARNLYWAVGPERLEEELAATSPERVAFWLYSFASVGRAGVPPRPGPVAAAGYIAAFLSRRARGVARKVIREQEELLGDEWFLETVSTDIPV